MARELPKTADAVVIGAGSVGTCVAYHLAKMGCGKVVLLEKESIASGSTGRSAGMFHQQFGSELLLQLAVESVRFFEHIAEEEGFGLALRQVGYVNLLCTLEELEKARQALPLQHRLGAEVEILSPAEIANLLPDLGTDDLVGATNCRRDGHMDPHLATNAVAELARREGVEVFVGTAVTDLRVESGRVQGVITPRGEIATTLAINTAGPWAGLVGKMAGVAIPVKPFRRQLWFTQRIEAIRASDPIIFDKRHDFYFRPEGPGAVMCLGNPREESNFSTQVDWDFAPAVAEFASRRFPPLGDAGLVSAWAAPRDISPDHQSILGFIPEVEGFLVAAGHSGHGFMMAPALGRVMAELALEKKSSPDVSSLGVSRFPERELPDSAYTPLGI